MRNFFDIALDRWRSGCGVVVGIDPVVQKIPCHLADDKDALEKFVREIIEATEKFAIAFKSNLAFFLSFGSEGVEILRKMRKFSRAPIILDAKFGDVPHTAEQYANFAFNYINADAVTVNPYIGNDCIEIFAKRGGVFVLAATSNTGFSDFQEIPCDGEPLFIKVAKGVSALSENLKITIGLVVGATHPSALEQVRLSAPELPFLIPGIGAQDGKIENIIKFAFTSDGYPPFINASRSIIYASSGTDFAKCAEREAQKLSKIIRSQVTQTL